MKRRQFSSYEKRRVGARQAWKCGLCDVLLTADYEIDHITPLHKSGADCLETNCHAVCQKCHSHKTLNENIERVRKRQQKLELSVEAARRADPLSDEYIDSFTLNNPFLKFVHIHPTKQQPRTTREHAHECGFCDVRTTSKPASNVDRIGEAASPRVVHNPPKSTHQVQIDTYFTRTLD